MCCMIKLCISVQGDLKMRIYIETFLLCKKCCGSLIHFHPGLSLRPPSKLSFLAIIIIIIIIMAVQPFVGPWPLFSVSWSYTQSVGLLGRGISPSQGRYLHTEQHKNRINAHNTDIHALSGVRTHDPSVWANEDCSCLRPRGHWYRPLLLFP
jgi:hypothetical protein